MTRHQRAVERHAFEMAISMVVTCSQGSDGVSVTVKHVDPRGRRESTITADDGRLIHRQWWDAQELRQEWCP